MLLLQYIHVELCQRSSYTKVVKSLKLHHCLIAALLCVSFGSISNDLSMPSFIDSQFHKLHPFHCERLLSLIFIRTKSLNLWGSFCRLEAFLPRFDVHVPIEHRGLPAVQPFLKWTPFAVYCDPSTVFFLLHQIYGPWEKRNMQHFKILNRTSWYYVCLLYNDVTCRQRGCITAVNGNI